ncbi:LysR family transcriptional regulator [Comamonas terrae]|uniref:LysR family transcriptional regulator n=1 Tax=Comamonas terrae TaxID=673548 RepID=A0ABW5UU95_9BURK
MRLLGRLRGIDVFVATANAGSFGAASRSLCLTESAVRKAIARLKERLDTQLFKRLPQNLELTKTGARFHRHCAGQRKRWKRRRHRFLKVHLSEGLLCRCRQRQKPWRSAWPAHESGLGPVMQQRPPRRHIHMGCLTTASPCVRTWARLPWSSI